MFEGNLTESGFDQDVQTDGLKPLDWSALTARLSAARELRGALANHRDSVKGNFACFSKSGPETGSADEQINENGVCVNPDTLADGKSCAGNKPDIAIDTQSGDRE